MDETEIIVFRNKGPLRSINAGVTAMKLLMCHHYVNIWAYYLLLNFHGMLLTLS